MSAKCGAEIVGMFEQYSYILIRVIADERWGTFVFLMLTRKSGNAHMESISGCYLFCTTWVRLIALQGMNIIDRHEGQLIQISEPEKLM